MQIYKTTNLINGKIYVGQEKGNNEQYLGSGLLLNYAIKKYGRKNFKKDIIKKCWSKQEINESEKYWIKALESRNLNIGYNIAIGGQFGDVLSSHPNKIEIYKKISQSVKKNIKINPNFGMKGKKQSDFAKAKLSKLRIGIKLSEEHKKSICDSCKIKCNTKEHREKLSKAHCKKGFGPKCSEETKIKIGNAAKNRKKEKCIYCKNEYDVSNLKKWHNENCKLNPNLNFENRKQKKWTDERRELIKKKFLIRKQTSEYNSEENKIKRSIAAKLSHLTRKLNKGEN